MAKLTEAQLRKLVREELASGVRPSHSPVSSKVDISPLQDQITDVCHKAAAILKDSLGVEIDDAEWNRLGVPNRLANKVVQLLRKELIGMTDEWQGESAWQSSTQKAV